MIKKAVISDADEIAALAVILWNSHNVKDLTDEFSDFIQNENGQIFLKYCEKTLVGFAQCSIRNDYVEGSSTRPVGYLEGIFVKEEFRGNGYAKELLIECERWAKNQGCREFASDCETENDSSFRFHIKSGFAEANRIICFIKKL
ncbi:MAG: GNAT family N-acetyltransferase [Oscillospiraceae bacterium]|nr:GNAT family N-acetyltransferase [Oscillospiraceae bacterium]